MSNYHNRPNLSNFKASGHYINNDVGPRMVNGRSSQHKPQTRKKKPFILNGISETITSTMENGFYRDYLMLMQQLQMIHNQNVETAANGWFVHPRGYHQPIHKRTKVLLIGHFVGLHPLETIVVSAIIMGAFGAGFIKFTEISDSIGLWVPSEADVIKYKDWVSDQFSSTTRTVTVLVVENNVLTPAVLQAMFSLYKKSLIVQASSNKIFDDLCLRSGPLCRVSSILELWRYNETAINALTESDIHTAVKSTTKSPTYFNEFDVSNVLGEVTKNGSDDITGAKATKITWYLQGGSDPSTELDNSINWERKVVDMVLSGYSGLSDMYVTSRTSYVDAVYDSLSSDAILLIFGYMVVIVFVMVILGRFNFVDFGLGISVSGFMVIGISIVFSYGLASVAGWEYTPLHSILPFLLLGIGVDDLFVVVMAYKNLPPFIAEKPVPERIAMTLKHAGVSITVTSLTDMCVFGIGATSVLPALRSFCIFACLGILALYILSCTFFVGWLSLNAKRADSYRNAIICCYKHKPEYSPNECSKKEVIVTVFKQFYGPFLMKLPVKIIVMVMTVTMLGFGLWGFTVLEQDFDPIWFIPTDSIPSIFDRQNDRYFPSSGASAAVYCKNIDYFSLKSKFDQLNSKMSSSKYIASGTTDSWFMSYTGWLTNATETDIVNKLDSNKYPDNETDFYELLHGYITTQQSGLRHKREIQFSNTTSLKITASVITFRYVDFKKSKEKVEAMDSTLAMVSDIFPGEECFAYGMLYLRWFTNKVIQRELYMNLGIASACVFVVCLVLIANVVTSLLVFTCVIFTLINVGGVMHFWGLTIDTVTSIIMIVSVGLAVDYSAHIGHCFMTFAGSRNDRVKATLVEMGSPVFSGGFSTFLAFVLVAGSNSYAFTTFFKVFLLVVIFGLFHGLAYLPVLLSWIGPPPYFSSTRVQEPMEEVEIEVKYDRSKLGVDNPVMYNKPRKPEMVRPPPYDYAAPVKDVTPYLPPPDYTPPSKPKFYRGPKDRQNKQHIYSVY